MKIIYKLSFLMIIILIGLTSCNKNSKKYTISFDIDGNVTSVELKKGDDIIFPQATKEGYDFVGWELNGKVFSEYVVEDKNLTFKAKFELKKYLISFNIDGEIITTELANGEQVTFPFAMKENFTFIGWKLNDNFVTEYTVDESDVTFIAEFKNTNIIELENAFERFTFSDKIIDNKIPLKTNFYYQGKNISGSWVSSNVNLIDNEGYIVSYPEEETVVTLTLTLKYNNETLSKDYYVTLLPKTIEELLDLALEEVGLFTTITNQVKVDLPTEFAYNIVGSWESSDENILTSDGVVKVFNQRKEVKMTLKYAKEGDSVMKNKEFTFTVDVNTAMHVLKANTFDSTKMENVELSNGKLVLTAGQIVGTYESQAIETIKFKSLVASWAAISSKVATVELQISVRVDGTFSEYITYCAGGWGLGLKNASYDQNNGIIKLSTDEVMVLNNKVGDAVKFKLILRRNSTTDSSPQVSLVSLALEGSEFTGLMYQLEDLSPSVKYDVPRLYQGAVPTIGNSICSPTSSTMLLKYKGMDFSSYDSEFEHRYIAGIAMDYGNDIYGNWVYNTVTMGGYGFDAYTARLYSINELAHHLDTVGPVAISVKGQMTSNKKDYYTGGHLLCIIGYTYQDGVLTFIANDPNVPEVECTYSQSVILRTWRNIIYVIE